jgi:hypothetical protein
MKIPVMLAFDRLHQASGLLEQATRTFQAGDLLRGASEAESAGQLMSKVRTFDQRGRDLIDAARLAQSDPTDVDAAWTLGNHVDHGVLELQNWSPTRCAETNRLEARYDSGDAMDFGHLTGEGVEP